MKSGSETRWTLITHVQVPPIDCLHHVFRMRTIRGPALSELVHVRGRRPGRTIITTYAQIDCLTAGETICAEEPNGSYCSSLASRLRCTLHRSAR